jgi:hypothetical protein
MLGYLLSTNFLARARYRNVIESAKKASMTPLTEPQIFCYMCKDEIKSAEWLILWNNELPVAQKNLYDICDGCYLKLVSVVEQEHAGAHLDLVQKNFISIY